jgi:hypothetical protein
VLRIGLPSSFAIREIIPRLLKFLDKHPALLLLGGSPRLNVAKADQIKGRDWCIVHESVGLVLGL